MHLTFFNKKVLNQPRLTVNTLMHILQLTTVARELHPFEFVRH